MTIQSPYNPNANTSASFASLIKGSFRASSKRKKVRETKSEDTVAIAVKLPITQRWTGRSEKNDAKITTRGSAIKVYATLAHFQSPHFFTNNSHSNEFRNLF